MKDIGVDRRDSSIGMPAPEEPMRKYYPSFTIGNDALPMLKGKNVGETIKVEVEFKILGIRTAEDWDPSDAKQTTLELRKVGEPE